MHKKMFVISKGFYKRKGCVNQMFTLKMIVEMYLEEGGRMFGAFMNLEKSCNIFMRCPESIWCGKAFTSRDQFFCKGASLSVSVNEELSELWC